VSIGRNVEVCRQGEVWVVVHAAELLYEFSADDAATKRLCMAQLSLAKLAAEQEIARAFGCSRATVCRAKAAFLKQGARGLVPKRRGPKGSRMEPGLEAKILRLRREGRSYTSMSRELVLPRSTVRTVCKRHGLTGPDRQGRLALDEGAATTGGQDAGELPEPVEGAEDESAPGRSATTEEAGPSTPEVDGPTPPPAVEVAPGEPAPARTAERAFARAGLLGQAEVAPEFVSGSEVPAAGVLLAIALVAEDGCLAVARRVYGALSNGFYGLRALVLTLLTSAWLGLKSLDSFQHGTPHLWGRLVGLDRLPETKTLARKLNEIAGRQLAREFMSQMAEHRIQANKAACAVLYVDGHVRQYHGRRRVSKRFVSRRGLAMPAIEDWWVHDGACSPLLKIPGRPDRSLVATVPEIVRDARQWIGEARPLTVVFDRAGWSPKLFAELAAQGVRVVTYRKGKRRAYPAREFDLEITIAGRHGNPPKVYRTRDRRTRIRGHTFRSVTVLGTNDHQTEITTTDLDSDTAVILAEMFSRWGQENYFKYERTHRRLDALGSYAFEPVPDDVEVPNPEHRKLDRQVKKAQARLRELEAASAKGSSAKPTAAQLKWWRARVANLKARRRAAGCRIRVGDLPKDQRPEQPNPERKLFTDVLDTSASRIETRLLGLLAPHYRSTHKDGRELLRQIVRDTGDLTLEGGVLTVTLNPLASPHQTVALAGLCRELNATDPAFPETNLRLCFQVHDHS
jgi:hypothetical protein